MSDKVLGIIVSVFVSALLILLIGSSYGFHFGMTNYLADNAAAAGVGFKVLGTFFYVASVGTFFYIKDAMTNKPTGSIILMGVLLALGVCANCGFKFDIAG